jgi:hypothetical protein
MMKVPDEEIQNLVEKGFGETGPSEKYRVVFNALNRLPDAEVDHGLPQKVVRRIGLAADRSARRAFFWMWIWIALLALASVAGLLVAGVNLRSSFTLFMGNGMEILFFCVVLLLAIQYLDRRLVLKGKTGRNMATV